MIDAGQKIRVVSAYGYSALGEMTPQLDMVTDAGTITRINGVVVEVSGAGVTAVTAYFPAQLTALSGHAAHPHLWPSGNGSVVYGHATLFPNGVPLASPTVSAMLVMPDGSHRQVNF